MRNGCARRGHQFGVLALLVGSVLSAAAFADDKAASATTAGPTKDVKKTDVLEEVVVTGSRIARPDLERLQPTVVVSAASMDERGQTNVADALDELPAFGVPPSSAANTQGSFGIAQSFVDLYSLGSQRTLTLVNGMRFVSSNTPSIFGAAASGDQVDLNVIPSKLIERIETISVGGAPIYGSDAISGTVNIILKKDYQGLDVDVQAGASQLGDATSWRARALMGKNFADGKGNSTLSVEFSKADGLRGLARPVYAQDLGFLAPASPGQYKQYLYPQNRVASINQAGMPLVDDIFNPFPGVPPNQGFGVSNAAGQLLAFGNGGSYLKPYNVGTLTGNPVFSVGGDGLSLASVSNLLSPLERINVTSLNSVQWTDNVRVFSEFWYSGTHAQNLQSQPQYNTAFFGNAGDPSGNLVMSLSNPFLAANDRATISNALNAYAANPLFGSTLAPNWNPNTFYLARGSSDLQSGFATADQVVTRGVMGLEGKFSIGSRNFTWDAAANYGYSRNGTVTPQIVWQNMLNALNATTDAGGNIVCGGTPVAAPVSTLSSSCAPLNVFGNGSPSQAAKDYITHNAEATSITTQRDVTANISGDLFALPAGEVKGALGFENRRETASFSPDSFYSQGLGTGAAITGIAGDFRTNEIFAETLVPLVAPVQNIPFVHNLQLEAAIRRVDNSISGSANTWTVGLRWSPIQDIQFRGNKTSSIRDPAITELFLPTSNSFTFANDPCDENFIDKGTAPATRKANCAAAGITQPFTSNIVNATAKSTVSGNANLQPEHADSRTVGFVLRPRWTPKLNLTMDYIDIQLSNAIESLSATQILNACYDATDYPNNSSCNLFQRNSAGQITIVHTGYVNAGYLRFTGLASALDWTVDVPTFGHGEPGSLGSLEFRLSHLDTMRLTSKIGSASENNNAGELGTNKSKGQANMTYRKGPFSWYWQGIFVGNAAFSNTNVATTQNYWGVSNWWLINSTIGYQMADNTRVRLIVSNVFDKEPPFPALAGSGGNFANATSQYFSGIIGRSYMLSADIRF